MTQVFEGTINYRGVEISIQTNGKWCICNAVVNGQHKSYSSIGTTKHTKDMMKKFIRKNLVQQ